MSALATSNIPFEEFTAIKSVIDATIGLSSEALRAVLVFGDLVATGETHDINLVEVVENWQGPRRVAFSSTPELPLRSRLTLYFLLPHEFETWPAVPLPGEDFSAANLLYKMEPAYGILLERPHAYAFDAMRTGGTQAVGPMTFLHVNWLPHDAANAALSRSKCDGTGILGRRGSSSLGRSYFVAKQPISRFGSLRA